MLALYLLQSALVYVNTLLIQRSLAEPTHAGKVTAVDRQALSPLYWSHVNPYCTFRLDMESRLDLDRGSAGRSNGHESTPRDRPSS